MPKLHTFLRLHVSGHNPRKTHPCLTERLLMGCKVSNQTNKQTKSGTTSAGPIVDQTCILKQ